MDLFFPPQRIELKLKLPPTQSKAGKQDQILNSDLAIDKKIAHADAIDKREVLRAGLKWLQLQVQPLLYKVSVVVACNSSRPIEAGQQVEKATISLLCCLCKQPQPTQAPLEKASLSRKCPLDFLKRVSERITFI